MRREHAADAKTRHAIELGVVGIGGSTILILLFGLYLARVIAAPVSEAAEGAEQARGRRPVGPFEPAGPR